MQSTSDKKLHDGISEAKIIIDLFLNNQFEQSKKRFLDNSTCGMYERLANSTILFIEAIATVEEGKLESAKTQLKSTLSVCNAARRKNKKTIGFSNNMQLFKSVIQNEYTEEQAHAELCYAEGLLQITFLTMLQDDKFSSLVKCSLKIRQCYKCYRNCWRMLNHCQWKDEISRSAFESGVRLGVGAFDLMISLLPNHVLRLLKFIGFSGNRHFGLQQLRMGARMTQSLRGPLCGLLLLIFDLYATHILGDTVVGVRDEQPELIMEARELLLQLSAIYQHSAIFLLLTGRLEAISGNLTRAIAHFESSIESKCDWIHYHQLCYWELIWCYALQANWKQAIKYTNILSLQSLWSQASYCYMNAAFLLQDMDDHRNELSQRGVSSIMTESEFEENQALVDRLLEDIPSITKRFGGRALPMEKIALRKSKRYFTQNKRLVLPALELMFIWNGFKAFSAKQESILTFLMLCESKINELLDTKEQNKCYYDDYCLALMLKGVCLRCRKQAFQATMCFTEIIQTKAKLKNDSYLLPFCEMELCQLAYEDNDLDNAAKHLAKAQHYKGYHLESRLQFRIHEMENKLKEIRHSNSRKKSYSENSIILDQLAHAPISSVDNSLRQSGPIIHNSTINAPKDNQSVIHKNLFEMDGLSFESNEDDDDNDLQTSD